MKAVLVLVACISGALAYPSIHAEAEKCSSSVCSVKDNCVCSSSKSPVGEEDTPQFVTLSFDDSIHSDDVRDYIRPLLSGRKNNDGSPVTATFYIPHDYTNYIEVNGLYNDGHDIGVHSITKGPADYFQNATVNTLVDEFNGQRVIISTFANIPINDIRGVRTPHFELNGDVTFEAYVKSGLGYDNSWPTNRDSPVFPYTLNYKSTQSCLVGKCPTSAFPGFWVQPIINNEGDNGYPCNVLFACIIEGESAEEVRDWLIGQYEYHNKNGTRAPVTVLVNAVFFKAKKNGFEGLQLFLNHLSSLKDTFVVSHREVNRWAKNPVPLDQYKPAVENRNAKCNPRTCKLPHGEQERLMGFCVTCPDEYPWLGNPLGE